MKECVAILMTFLCYMATAVTFDLPLFAAVACGLTWACFWAFICSCFFD